MGRRKADVSIGYRASAEILRLTDSTKHACQLIGCTKELLRMWRNGVAPSAIYLIRLHEIGADVIYILTGERND
jgi:hypothetical protein